MKVKRLLVIILVLMLMVTSAFAEPAALDVHSLSDGELISLFQRVFWELISRDLEKPVLSTASYLQNPDCEYVIWTDAPGISVYHTSMDCPALRNVEGVHIGELSQAIEAGHTRLCRFCQMAAEESKP